MAAFWNLGGEKYTLANCKYYFKKKEEANYIY